MTTATLCKSGQCWAKNHRICRDDWVADSGIWFHCTCECHGPDRRAPVAGDDMIHDEMKDTGADGWLHWTEREAERHKYQDAELDREREGLDG